MEEQAVSNQVQQPTIPTSPEPKHRSFLTSKLFLITLTILILFTAVYAGIYLYLGSQLDQISKSSPTPLPAETSAKEGDPTANWKTYSGEFFSFQYPKEWIIAKSDISFVSLQKEEFREASGPFPAQAVKATITAYWANLTTDITLDKWLESRYLRGEDENLFELTKDGMKKTMLGGVDALAVIVPGGAGYIDEGTVAVNKDKGYDVSIIGVEIKGAHDTYQTILKTFKFLDQDQTVCTADAKMCPDGSYVSRQPPTCEFAACP